MKYKLLPTLSILFIGFVIYLFIDVLNIQQDVRDRVNAISSLTLLSNALEESSMDPQKAFQLNKTEQINALKIIQERIPFPSHNQVAAFIQHIDEPNDKQAYYAINSLVKAEIHLIRTTLHSLSKNLQTKWVYVFILGIISCLFALGSSLLLLTLRRKQQLLTKKSQELENTGKQLEKANHALSLQQETLRDLTNHVPGMVFSYLHKPNGGTALLFVSEGAKDLFGKPVESLDTVWERIHEQDREKMKQSMLKSIQELVPWSHEARVKNETCKDQWIHARGTVKKLPEGNRVLHALIIEITALKEAQKLKEENNVMSKLAHTIPGVLFQFSINENEQTRLQFMSNGVEKLYGIQPEQISQLDDLRKNIHPEDIEAYQISLKAATENDQEWAHEFRVKKKGGTDRWIQSHGFSEALDSGETSWFIAEFDITDLKTIEIDNKKLIWSQSKILEEKNTLLKELHHRINGNLQWLSSLLMIKSRSTPNKDLAAFIHETSQRILTMAKVHEQLDYFREVDQLNIREFIDDLGQNLMQTYTHEENELQLELNIEDHLMDIDVVLTVGLLINEFVSNAVKYAFPGIKKGTISLSFSKKKDHFELTLADNGIGISNQVLEHRSEHYGLTLIDLFVDQLGGTLEVSGEKGSRFNIRFF